MSLFDAHELPDGVGDFPRSELAHAGGWIPASLYRRWPSWAGAYALLSILFVSATGWSWNRWMFLTAASLAGVLLLAAPGWLLHRTLSRRRQGRFISLALRNGLCPSCAYGIGDIPPDQDELLVCPECGAAWSHPETMHTPSSSDR